MRWPVVACLWGAWLLVPACATVSSEQSEQNDLLWQAAQECQARYPGIELSHIGPDGRLSFRYAEDSRPDLEQFQACYRERAESVQLAGVSRVAPRPGTPTRTSVPIQVVGGLVRVPVLVNGQAATLLLDTGASKTIITPDLAARAGLAVSSSAVRLTTIVAGGGRISIPLARARAVRVGELTVEDLDVGVYDFMPDAKELGGTLGGDFLRFFRVTLDRSARQLTLEVTQ